MFDYNPVGHGFSNFGLRATTGMPTIVYWHVTIMKYRGLKVDEIMKYK